MLKHAAAEMGLRIREYVPVGEMIPGMAYLVRRLLENTSNESWLKAGFMDNADAGVLLASPHELNPERKRGANGAVISGVSSQDGGGISLELGGKSSGISPEKHKRFGGGWAGRWGMGGRSSIESMRDFSVAGAVPPAFLVEPRWRRRRCG